MGQISHKQFTAMPEDPERQLKWSSLEVQVKPLRFYLISPSNKKHNCKSQIKKKILPCQTKFINKTLSSPYYEHKNIFSNVAKIITLIVTIRNMTIYRHLCSIAVVMDTTKQARYSVRRYTPYIRGTLNPINGMQMAEEPRLAARNAAEITYWLYL